MMRRKLGAMLSPTRKKKGTTPNATRGASTGHTEAPGSPSATVESVEELEQYLEEVMKTV